MADDDNDDEEEEEEEQEERRRAVITTMITPTPTATEEAAFNVIHPSQMNEEILKIRWWNKQLNMILCATVGLLSGALLYGVFQYLGV